MEAYHDPKRRARMLGSEERGKWLNVDGVIAKAGISPGMVCVDLGCGAGALSIPLSKAVGEKGKVYAVDTAGDVLDIIREKNPPDNLVVLQKDAAGTGLNASIADRCFMVLLLHEVPPEGVIAEAYRLLKSGGRAIILEWRMDFDSPRPPRNERIDTDRMELLLTQAGFSSFESTEWSDSQYLAAAVKS